MFAVPGTACFRPKSFFDLALAPSQVVTCFCFDLSCFRNSLLQVHCFAFQFTRYGPQPHWLVLSVASCMDAQTAGQGGGQSLFRSIPVVPVRRGLYAPPGVVVFSYYGILRFVAQRSDSSLLGFVAQRSDSSLLQHFPTFLHLTLLLSSRIRLLRAL